MDAIAVRQACQRAVDRARAGEGPTLVEAKTYRYYDHQGVKGLRRPYRTEEEVEAWKKRDAIELLEARAAADGVADAGSFARIWEETRADAADAIAFAQSSPEPDPSTVTRNVYSD
jgi:TPP-dependent pyruvate/acetoin dehydrogenase alpha subunit